MRWGLASAKASAEHAEAPSARRRPTPNRSRASRDGLTALPRAAVPSRGGCTSGTPGACVASRRAFLVFALEARPGNSRDQLVDVSLTVARRVGFVCSNAARIKGPVAHSFAILLVSSVAT